MCRPPVYIGEPCGVEPVRLHSSARGTGTVSSFLDPYHKSTLKNLKLDIRQCIHASFGLH